jgi:radical SAM protein with 4Fe4S-binding SPASM domain
MADKYRMTGHKLFWHLGRVNDWIRRKRFSPLQVELGVTTGCNLACKYCYGTVMGRTNAAKRFDMPLETMKRLFRDCKDVGVKSISITGEGENTLNPGFYDALNYAREIKLDVGLATNGTALKKDRIQDMLASLVYLRFNISAATPESYRIIHGRKLFDEVIHNIEECVRLKREYNIPVTIGLQMVIVQENINDIILLSKLGKELGVDYVVMKPCSDTPDNQLDAPHNEYKDLEEICKTAEGLSGNGYSVIVKWKKLNNEGVMPYEICYGTQFMIAINGMGDVAPCGHLLSPLYKEKFHMGNIIKKSFREILHSDRYWEVQKKVQSLNVNKNCESNCKQYSINVFLNQLKHPPDHINFP